MPAKLAGGDERSGRAAGSDRREDNVRERGEHKAVPMVSAWVNENNLVLVQVATEEQSNEITVIPELLDLIDVSGDTITIDAAD
jgi:hypothetical protein